MKGRVPFGAVLCGLLVLSFFGAPCYADQLVLSGVPDYYGPLPPDMPALSGNAPDLTVATLDPSAARPQMGVTSLSGVPTYLWWYGCSPTSGGVMVGFWDQKAGYGGLYDGDASVWGGGGGGGTRRMVASTAHITAGSENGYTYGDWHNSASYLNHATHPECIADFIHTVNGGSYSDCITQGLERYVEWDGTWGGTTYMVKQAYPATTANIDVPYWSGGTYTWGNFKSEIDAGRPVLLNIMTYSPVDSEWVGHSVVGYGYQDDMFQVRVPLGGNQYVNETCGGFAIKDTWTTGSTAQSDWYDWNSNILYPTIDGNGIEWWPFVPIEGTSYTARWDWMVSDAVTLNIDLVPEPATMTLLALGGVALLLRTRRGR